jgi:glycosyltransferase involved in cell wall biosynthesis
MTPPIVPRRVLLVCAGYPPDLRGGGEKSTQILAQALTALGHNVCVLTLSDSPGQRLDSDGRTRIVMLHSPNIYWNFRPHDSLFKKVVWHSLDNYNPRAIRAVEDAIRRERPDVVLSSTIENFGPAIWQASHRLGVPVVHILRSYYMRCLRGTMFRDGSNCAAPCTACQVFTVGRRVASAQVDALVGISAFVLEQHSQLFPSALRRVIPNAVPGRSNSRAARFSNETVTFGYLGRLEPEKGIADVLAVFARMPAHCHLLVAGVGLTAYEKSLRARFASDRIRFLGWVKVDSVYPLLDFAVMPSLWNEPFGRVAIEAFSHGVPVIAAARGGLSELVAHGRSGYLYEPDRSGDLAQVCLLAAESMHLHDGMATNVRREAQRYSPSSMARQYDHLFRSLLSE